MLYYVTHLRYRTADDDAMEDELFVVRTRAVSVSRNGGGHERAAQTYLDDSVQDEDYLGEGDRLLVMVWPYPDDNEDRNPEAKMYKLNPPSRWTIEEIKS